MVWPCDFLVGRKCFEWRVSHRISWIGVAWFITLFSLSILGSVTLTGTNYVDEASESDILYRNWFIICAILRFIDILTSFFTAIRRRITPNRRKKFILLSFFGRSVSFLGEISLGIIGIIFLSEHGAPQLLTKGPLVFYVARMAFYFNFLSIAIFCGALVNPCAIAIIFIFCICSDSLRDQDEEEYHRPRFENRDINRNIAQQFVGEPQVRAQPAQSGWRLFVKKIGMNDILGADDLECPICLQPFGEDESVDQLACEHYFHTQCLELAYSQPNAQQKCPNCRQDIRVARNLHKVENENV